LREALALRVVAVEDLGLDETDAGVGEDVLLVRGRTRWEMEANGTFSIQGTLELAYVMGLIKHFEGRPLRFGS
jgi:hypothetical protein